MSTVGENILMIRKQLGLTQEELASKMGYKSKSTINKIELGINDIPQSKIVKFAEVLGTTPSFLMGWEEVGETASKETPFVYDELSEKRKSLIDFALTVPEDKAEMLLRVMKSIVEGD